MGRSRYAQSMSGRNGDTARICGGLHFSIYATHFSFSELTAAKRRLALMRVAIFAECRPMPNPQLLIDNEITSET